MNIVRNIKGGYRLGWVVVFSVLFLTSCVYDNEFSILNDQIAALNKRVTNLQGSLEPKIDARIDARLASDLESKLESVNRNQTEVVVEIDQLRRDIKEISGRIEDNEHVLRSTVEKDLNDQDAIRAQLAELNRLVPRIKELEMGVGRQAEYLGLEPKVPSGEKEGEEKPVVGEEVKEQKPKELELYDLSLTFFRQEKFEQSSDGFRRFLSEFPKSDRADNAQFWIGECLMALKQYEQGILAYQKVIKNYPKGNKVPNAMLRQAVAFLEIKDKTSATLLLKKVAKQYPKSNEAKIATAKLKTIK